jgi:LPXTG-site transpeptidase (sortase) family protein
VTLSRLMLKLKNRSSTPRWIERLLFLIGIVCLGTWLYAFVDTRLYEMRKEQRQEEAIRQRSSLQAEQDPPELPEPHRTATETDALGSFQRDESEDSGLDDEFFQTDLENLAEGDLVGRIKIPRVGVSAIVLHGVGKKTLRRGVGHIPGTALPEHGGNVGLAGHRDSFFRGLKDIRTDDTIEITTPEGTFEYRVEWTKIVRPRDTDVLEAEEGTPSLTLVTCYPFYYVGSAPKRFIVRAHRIGGPEEARIGAN